MFVLSLVMGLIALYAWQRNKIKQLSKESATQMVELEQYELIFNATLEMIWLKDTQNIVVNLNELAVAPSCGTAEQLRGISAYELHPEHAEKYYKDDLDVIRTKQTILDIVERYVIYNEKQWIQFLFNVIARTSIYIIYKARNAIRF